MAVVEAKSGRERVVKGGLGAVVFCLGAWRPNGNDVSMQ